MYRWMYSLYVLYADVLLYAMFNFVILLLPAIHECASE